MAGECQKLKFNRRRLGLSQKEFADLVGLSQSTICKLEKSEDAWTFADSETIDKIYAHYESMVSYQPNKKEVKNVMDDIRTEDKKEENELIDPKALEFLTKNGSVEKKLDEEISSTSSLTVGDIALKRMIDVLYDGLNNTKDHDEFEIHIKLLKKLLKKGK